MASSAAQLLFRRLDGAGSLEPSRIELPARLIPKLRRFLAWKRAHGESVAPDAPLFASNRRGRLSPRAVDAVLGIVLHGTFYCTLAVGKRWIESGSGGTMLNIVTTYAETGSGFVVPSAAAKAGVLAMMRSLAVEWALYGLSLIHI